MESTREIDVIFIPLKKSHRENVLFRSAAGPGSRAQAHEDSLAA
jgi:hypothetical protein